MTSPEAVEVYRRMSPGDRLALTLRAVREAAPHLTRGTPAVVDRRFQLLRRENDARNRQFLERLAAAGRADAGD